MRLLARIGLMVTLLLAGICSAQEAPKQVGYDIAACEPGGDYYAVHVKQDGADFIVDAFTDAPGVIQPEPKEVRYKFEKTEGGISSYVYMSGKNKLEMRVKLSVGRGIYLQDGVPSALLFIGADADGSTLGTFAVDNVKACQDLFPPDKAEQPDENKT